MDELNTPSPRPRFEMVSDREQIKTFVFFDLETTGLPNLESFKTRITELCLIACSRENILSTPRNQLPRILHKLSICLNPMKRISDEAEKLTGLSNFELEHERRFDKNMYDLLIHFLERHPPPICLVAHNGFRFDFPIIKHELLRLNTDMRQFDQLLVVDSLPLFRTIENTMSCEPAVIEFDTEVTDTEPLSPSQNNLIDKLYGDGIDWKLLNETTPKHKTDNTRPISTGSKTNKTSSRTNRKRPNCGRELFPVIGSTDRKKKTFTLTDIYVRLHDKQKPSSSHRAEGDVETLLSCVINVKDLFIKLSDKDSISFCDIKCMGQK